LIEAVIFDLDGLLVDSEPVWFKARKDFMNKFGLEWTKEDHKIQMGVSTEFWANYTFEKIDSRATHETIVEGILGRMISFYEEGEVETLPGADEALSYCSDNFIVGLASGSPLRLINAAIKGKGWEKYFKEIVSSDEVEKGKPAPDTFLEIYKRLDIMPDKTVVIEDSGGGILSGFNSGAKVIAVPNAEMMPSDDILAKASVHLKSLKDVPEAIVKFEKG